jgi:hypothetical protein
MFNHDTTWSGDGFGMVRIPAALDTKWSVTKEGLSRYDLLGNNSAWTGGLNVNQGTIALLADGSGGRGPIVVNSGTLLLGGGAEVSDRIPDGGSLTLAGGAVANSGVVRETLGTLTLTASSTVDFGSESASIRIGATADWSAAATLSIQRWSGNLAGGGTDRLVFGSLLTATQLGQFVWNDPDGLTGTFVGAIQLPDGEVVPVPEPGTWLAIAAVFLLAGFTERRRLAAAARALVPIH